MKSRDRHRLSWLNMPLLSMFLILLPSLEAKAKEKSAPVSQNERQLVKQKKKDIMFLMLVQLRGQIHR
ncbi:MAG: hypothetical protein ACFCU7_10690 [Pleurocapsa sp.]